MPLLSRIGREKGKHFTPCSSASFVNFEHVNADREGYDIKYLGTYCFESIQNFHELRGLSKSM